MAREDNLIPFNEMTEEQQRELASKGGIARAENIRRRKTLREELLLLLETGETQKNITLALLDRAARGDTKAFEVLRDSIGEKPTDKSEVKTELTITDEDKSLLNNLSERLK